MQARMKMMCVIVAVMAILACTTVWADIITPTGATAYTNYSGQPPTKLIADTQLTKPNPNDATTWTYKITDWNGWMASNNTPNDEWLLFDLGQSYNINKIDLWNYYQQNSGGSARGVKDFVVWKSDSSGTLVSQLATISLPADLFSNTKYPDMPCHQYALSGGTGVQWVKLVINSCQTTGSDGQPGVTGTGGGYVGLSAVRFESVVPEPSTLALLAAGLVGLLAYAWRKRK
jgi:hypothetical protein